MITTNISIPTQSVYGEETVFVVEDKCVHDQEEDFLKPRDKI